MVTIEPGSGIFPSSFASRTGKACPTDIHIAVNLDDNNEIDKTKFIENATKQFKTARSNMYSGKEMGTGCSMIRTEEGESKLIKFPPQGIAVSFLTGMCKSNVSPEIIVCHVKYGTGTGKSGIITKTRVFLTQTANNGRSSAYKVFTFSAKTPSEVDAEADSIFGQTTSNAKGTALSLSADGGLLYQNKFTHVQAEQNEQTVSKKLKDIQEGIFQGKNNNGKIEKQTTVTWFDDQDVRLLLLIDEGQFYIKQGDGVTDKSDDLVAAIKKICEMMKSNYNEERLSLRVVFLTADDLDLTAFKQKLVNGMKYGNGTSRSAKIYRLNYTSIEKSFKPLAMVDYFKDDQPISLLVNKIMDDRRVVRDSCGRYPKSVIALPDGNGSSVEDLLDVNGRKTAKDIRKLSLEEREKIISKFGDGNSWTTNKEENSIHTLIIDPSQTGISLNNVEFMYLPFPFRDYNQYKQMVGRGIRLCSHCPGRFLHVKQWFPPPSPPLPPSKESGEGNEVVDIRFEDSTENLFPETPFLDAAGKAVLLYDIPKEEGTNPSYFIYDEDILPASRAEEPKPGSIQAIWCSANMGKERSGILDGNGILDLGGWVYTYLFKIKIGEDEFFIKNSSHGDQEAGENSSRVKKGVMRFSSGGGKYAWFRKLRLKNSSLGENVTFQWAYSTCPNPKFKFDRTFDTFQLRHLPSQKRIRINDFTILTTRGIEEQASNQIARSALTLASNTRKSAEYPRSYIPNNRRSFIMFHKCVKPGMRGGKRGREPSSSPDVPMTPDVPPPPERSMDFTVFVVDKEMEGYYYAHTFRNVTCQVEGDVPTHPVPNLRGKYITKAEVEHFRTEKYLIDVKSSGSHIIVKGETFKVKITNKDSNCPSEITSSIPLSELKDKDGLKYLMLNDWMLKFWTRFSEFLKKVKEPGQNPGPAIVNLYLECISLLDDSLRLSHSKCFAVSIHDIFKLFRERNNTTLEAVYTSIKDHFNIELRDLDQNFKDFTITTKTTNKNVTTSFDSNSIETQTRECSEHDQICLNQQPKKAKVDPFGKMLDCFSPRFNNINQKFSDAETKLKNVKKGWSRVSLFLPDLEVAERTSAMAIALSTCLPNKKGEFSITKDHLNPEYVIEEINKIITKNGEVLQGIQPPTYIDVENYIKIVQSFHNTGDVNCSHSVTKLRPRQTSTIQRLPLSGS